MRILNYWRSRMDYKEWISEKAYELADEKYNKEFYDLSDELQMEVYNEAVEAYKDFLADQIDQLHELAKESRMKIQGLYNG